MLGPFFSLHGGFPDAVKRNSNWTSQRQQLVKLDDRGSLVFFGKWHHLMTKTNPRAKATAFVDELALRWRECMFWFHLPAVLATGRRILLWLFGWFTRPATLLQRCWELVRMSRPASHHPSHASLSGHLQGLSCVAGHVCSWRWRPCYANPPLRLRKVPFLPAQKGKQQRAECGCSLRGSALPPEHVRESQCDASSYPSIRAWLFFHTTPPFLNPRKIKRCDIA